MLDKTKQKFLQYLRFIGVALFIYVLMRVDWLEIWKILQAINIFYFILAIFLTIPVILIRTLKWQTAVKAVGENVPFKILTILFAKGLFLGAITPGKLGEFYRAKLLTDIKPAMRLAKSFFTVFYDRILDYLLTGILSIVSVLALFILVRLKISFLAVGFIAVFVLCIFYFFLSKQLSKKMLKFVLNIFIPRSFKEKSGMFVEEFFSEMQKTGKLLVLKLFFWYAVAFLLVALAHFFFAVALGIAVPFWYFILIIPLITFITVMPISISGIGTREVGFIFFFAVFQVSAEAAVAFSLLAMLWTLLLPLPGLFLTFFHKKEALEKKSSFGNKVFLTFDLELWHEGEWLTPYLAPLTEKQDYMFESILPLLGLLQKYNAKATFFVSGVVLEKYPDLIKTIYSQGHEIASHGLKHRVLGKFLPADFKKDLEKSRDLIKAITGESPKGFRAPHFSLNQQTKWVLPILAELGFCYDSSVFPLSTPAYGVSGSPITPYNISFDDILKQDSASSLLEIPMSIFSFGPLKIPIAGGLYFRLAPIGIYKTLLKNVQKQRPLVLYFHPYELCPEKSVQKAVPFSKTKYWLKERLRYYNIKKSFGKFEKLLQTFEFDSIENILKQ